MTKSPNPIVGCQTRLSLRMEILFHNERNGPVGPKKQDTGAEGEPTDAHRAMDRCTLVQRSKVEDDVASGSLSLR